MNEPESPLTPEEEIEYRMNELMADMRAHPDDATGHLIRTVQWLLNRTNLFELRLAAVEREIFGDSPQP